MALPNRNLLGRLVGYDQGVPVYAAVCCEEWASGKHLLGRLVGYDQGVPVYAAGCCMDEDNTVGRLIGYDGGDPVYAYSEPCCEAAGSSSAPADTVCETGACSAEEDLPDVLTATFSDVTDCACLDGLSVDIYLNSRGEGEGCIWEGCSDSVTGCDCNGQTNRKVFVSFSCGTGALDDGAMVICCVDEDNTCCDQSDCVYDEDIGCPHCDQEVDCEGSEESGFSDGDDSSDDPFNRTFHFTASNLCTGGGADEFDVVVTK